MPRDIPLGNGTLLFLYDKKGIIRDLYFPNVGMENHAQGYQFRLGVWVNGSFTWIDDEVWERHLSYEDDTLVARILYRNRNLGIELVARDVVDFHENLYVRELSFTNSSDRPIELRLFFHHDFHIYGTEIGDTACYKPDEKAILHYKGRRYFLMNTAAGNDIGVAQFATGIKKAKGLKGTWVDAEDGDLSGNPIAQGSVDSTCAVHLAADPGQQSTAYYWMSVDINWKGVQRVNRLVTERGPGYFIRRTADYWKLWLEKGRMTFDTVTVPSAVADLYKRSLLILRTHINHNGAVIASTDSDIQYYYRDTYSYLWPRDGAIVSYALDLAGYPIPSSTFFAFCGEILGREGFFLHKYTPDGSLASSWHPWVLDGKPELPIQEDETGLVLWALWEHFRLYRDVEFMKPLYRKLIKSAADFLCRYTDPGTGLPLPSYDLWEERHGIHTFTICSVIAGLRGAAGFTESFGETDLAEKYLSTAGRMREALIKYLFDGARNRFLSRLNVNTDNALKKDFTMDSSLFSLCLLGIFDSSDEKIRSTLEMVKDALWCKTDIGGMARYENDTYQTVIRPTPEIPGNPWIISTLWYAQYLIARSVNEEDLKKALEVIIWVAERALPSGVLPEQLNPFTGDPLSVSPLAWSHAEFVIAVQKYL
ncbi:MAG: glycoside hydrolase family 15 protein, partial [bacterium]